MSLKSHDAWSVSLRQAPSEEDSISRAAEVLAVVLSDEEEPCDSDNRRQQGTTTDEEEGLLRRDLEPRRTSCMVQPPRAVDKQQGQGRPSSLATPSCVSAALHSGLMAPSSGTSGPGELLPASWASVAPTEEKVDPPGACPALDVSTSGLFPATVLLSHGSERFGAAVRVSAAGKVEGVALGSRGPGAPLMAMGDDADEVLDDLLSHHPCIRRGGEEEEEEESSVAAARGGVSRPGWSSRGASSSSSAAAAPPPRQLLSRRIARGELRPSTAAREAAFARCGGGNDEDEAAEEGVRAAEELLIPSAADLIRSSSGRKKHLLIGHSNKVDDEPDGRCRASPHSRGQSSYCCGASGCLCNTHCCHSRTPPVVLRCAVLCCAPPHLPGCSYK